MSAPDTASHIGIVRVPVDVTGDHPHSGRRGTVQAIDGKISRFWILGGGPFYLVTFGEHDECYAERKHIRPLPPRDGGGAVRDEKPALASPWPPKVETRSQHRAGGPCP